MAARVESNPDPAKCLADFLRERFRLFPGLQMRPGLPCAVHGVSELHTRCEWHVRTKIRAINDDLLGPFAGGVLHELDESIATELPGDVGGHGTAVAAAGSVFVAQLSGIVQKFVSREAILAKNRSISEGVAHPVQECPGRPW